MVYTLFTQSFVLVNLTCFLKLKNQSQQTLRFLECSKDVRAVGTVDNSIFGQSCQIFQQLVGIFKIVPSPSHKMLWVWRGKGSIQTQVVVVDIWVALAGHRCQVEGRHWTYWNLGQSWEQDYCQKKTSKDLLFVRGSISSAFEVGRRTKKRCSWSATNKMAREKQIALIWIWLIFPYRYLKIPWEPNSSTKL